MTCPHVFHRPWVAIGASLLGLLTSSAIADPDATPPAAAITSPVPGSTLAGRSFAAVNGTASDDVAVDGVELRIERLSDGLFWNGIAGWSATAVMLPASIDGIAGTWTSTGRMPWLITGDYKITATAKDAAGNETSATATVTAPQPTLKFTNLTGLLPAGSSSIRVNALSWDGSVVIGQAVLPGSTQKRGFRWSEAIGLEILADLPGGTDYSDAKAVSADGEIIAGAAASTSSAATSATATEAARWNVPNSVEGAGDYTRGASNEPFGSAFHAISSDGSVAAGYGTYKNPGGTTSYFAPLRWTAAGGFTDLGDLPGGSATGEARGVSGDGSVLVGYSNAKSTDGLPSDNRIWAFRWTEAGGMVALPDMQSSYTSGYIFHRRSSAHGISADGSTAFGYWAEDRAEYASYNVESTRTHAVIWTDAGVQPLGQLHPAGYDRYSATRGVRGDGRIAVGRAAVGNDVSDTEAFIWRHGDAMRSLHDELAPFWTLNVPGTLTEATAISADGHTVAGVGTGVSGAFAWILTLPSVYPTPPDPPKPPDPPSAPVGEMLTRTATFTPKITFAESYTESVKSTTEVVEGESFTFREVIGSGTNSATIVASTAGIDLSAIDGDTPVIVTLGSFLHAASLSEDPAYFKGKTSASFNLMGTNSLGADVVIGTVKYVWNAKTLTVTIACSQSPQASIAYLDFVELVTGGAPGSNSAVIHAIIEASVGLGDAGGACDKVYVTGKATGSTRTFGSGDTAESFDLDALSISGNADYAPPVVAFTAPTANLRTTAATVNIAGTVKDPHPGETVQVRLNGGAFTEITPTIPEGATSVNWQLNNAALIPGPNLIEAKSTDASGNESLLVSRKATQVVMTPLAVSHVGTGSVSAGFEPASNREIGAVYTITATPGKGMVFDGWTGGITSNSAKLTFTMTAGLSLVANFIPNPFPAIVGDYRGLVTSANPSILAENGGFTVTPTATGTLTFKLSLGAASYTVANVKLNNNGTAAFAILRTKLPTLQVTLQIAMAPSDGHVTGTITGGGLNLTCVGDRTVIDALHPVPAGSYTLLFPQSLADQIGANDGSASLVIAANGLVTVVGKLSDATSFTATSNISKNGTIPLFAKIGTGLTTIAGVLQFNVVDGAPEGTLHWLHGVDTAVNVIGSLYTPPLPQKRILDTLNTSNGSAKVILSGGGLAAAIEKAVTISTASAVIVKPTGADKLIITIVPKPGTFAGSFVPPGATKAATITGVFFEDFSAGIGLFRTSTGVVGHVRIQAP